MKIESIELHDFKSYQSATVDLSGVSLASVVGANGAGKSSLLEACVFALTGGRGFRSLDSYIRQGAEECRVSLVFSTGGTRYRLTRTRSSRNSGKSTVELAREEAGLWVAEGTGVRETEAQIEQVLGVDEDTLLLTTMVSQGDAGSFFALRPAQRLEALGEILSLDDTYGPLEALFKMEADAAKVGLAEIRREIERLEADATALGERELMLADDAEIREDRSLGVADTERELADARERSRKAQDGLQEAREAQRHYEEVQRRFEALEERKQALIQEIEGLEARVAAKAGLETMLAGRSALEAELATLEDAERADAKLAEKRALVGAQVDAAKAAVLETSRQGKPKAQELERLKALAQSLADKITAIDEAESPVCDRCGQAVADVALVRTLEQLTAERDVADKQAMGLAGEVADLRERMAGEQKYLAELEQQLAVIPAGTFDRVRHRAVKAELERLEGVPAKLAEIGALEERLTQVRTEAEAACREASDRRDLDMAAAQVTEHEGAVFEATEAERAVGRAAMVLDERRAELLTIEKQVAGHEEAIRLLSPSRARLDELRPQARDLEEIQVDADLLRKAMSKWGVPALIVGNVLLALEREVNELLSLYDGGLAVRFESERETRDGSRDSLEILVYDGEDWRPFETFSGGERYRVSSAMRLGLAQLLAHRSGARVETLIVDEPEGLDVAGRQHLARILERMSGHFGLILLLTHYDDLKEALPSQVLVSRGADGLSGVEVIA